MPDKAIIFFDGVCNLCNGFVNFIIPRDQKNRFQFSSLQSAKAQSILHDHHYYFIDDISTVILLEDGKLFTQSTAVLKIARKMSGLWPLFYAFIIIPKPIRDFFYKRIANNRYRLFGKRDSCRMPSPELKSKFLE
jgi:predicted DCC family thiol-disulfide oxidoreductase YuxK